MSAIFGKHPTPGRVKTRLCPPLSPQQAAGLAEAMLADTVARCLAGDFRTTLVFAPQEGPWFRERFPGIVDQRPQVGDGLGERLARFVAEAFDRDGVRSLVVVGSDQPLVPLERLHEAHRALEEGVECVLGPDSGGGYYLIGLARSQPDLFTAVPMSGSGMCDATEALARSSGLRVTRLAEHADVDVPSDLERLRAALTDLPDGDASVDHPNHTRRFLAELPLPFP